MVAEHHHLTMKLNSPGRGKIILLIVATAQEADTEVPCDKL